jgi:hypothetical protein
MDSFVCRKIKDMKQLPIFIPLLFITTTGLALFIYYRALGRSARTVYLISLWLLIQAFLGLTGFYQVDWRILPRFLLLILPPLVFIILIFSTIRGRKFSDQADLKWVTLFHTIRIPVEWVLFRLFVHQSLPQVMTFEGRNFDFLAGISAPLIYYFGLVKRQWSAKIIIVWNVVALGLLLNIVVIAVLSMPTPIQQFGFEQPNIALSYFPYVWLPFGLVPMVLYAHLVAIRQLLFRRESGLGVTRRPGKD